MAATTYSSDEIKYANPWFLMVWRNHDMWILFFFLIGFVCFLFIPDIFIIGIGVGVLVGILGVTVLFSLVKSYRGWKKYYQK